MESIKTYLGGIIGRGALQHAYLFIGPEYSEKKKVIEWFIEQIPHTERINILPKVSEKGISGDISIQEIREVLETLSHSTLDGKRRIITIEKADRLNKESSNALLKNLEEPPEGTLFILSVSHISAVLGTIASRCQYVRFASRVQIDEGRLEAKKNIFETLLHAPQSSRLLQGKELTPQDLDLIDMFLYTSLRKGSDYSNIVGLYDRVIQVKRALAMRISERSALDHLYV